GGCEFTIVEGAHRCRAQLPVPRLHMVQNAMLAVAAGRAFGVSLEECAAGLVAAPLCKARLQIREINGVQFIDDSYNANPDSMKAALRTLMELDADGKRVAVLGRMLELGAESERGHREVGETAATLGIDYLISIADDTIAVAAEKAGLENFAVAKDASEAAEMLGAIVGPGDLVLIKGSRSSRTELVLDELAELHGGKQGTPTMGGVLVIGAVFLASVLWARPDNRFVWLVLFSMLYLGVLGFLDDYLKVTKKKSDGVPGRVKLAAQLVLAAVV